MLPLRNSLGNHFRHSEFEATIGDESSSKMILPRGNEFSSERARLTLDTVDTARPTSATTRVAAAELLWKSE